MCVGKFWCDGKIESLKKKLGTKQGLRKEIIDIEFRLCASSTHYYVHYLTTLLTASYEGTFCE